MPNTDRCLADEGFQSRIIRHHLINPETLHHEAINEVASQEGGPIQHQADHLGQHAVLVAHHAKLAHAVAIAGGEVIRGDLTQLITHLDRGHHAKATHQPVQIALV